MTERGNPFLRIVDRMAGPPMLRALSVLRRTRALPSAPRRIGVLCFGALGDMLLLSAIVQDLRGSYPGAEIVLLGSSTNRTIAPLLQVPEFVDLPVTRPDKALWRIRELRLDIILDSTQWACLPALLCGFSGASTVGFRTEGRHRHFAYDVTVTHRNDQHEIENFRDLARKIATLTEVMPQLRVDSEARARVSELGLGRYAVLHPWPSGVRADLKEWPTASWGLLAQGLQERGMNVVLTGAPVDVPKSRAMTAVVGGNTWLHDLAGKLNLGETAALLEQAALIVSVNTGIMHMAACLDVPVIGLSGPTNPLRWGPLSSRAVSPKPECEGCWYLNLGFEYPDSPPDCMGAISVEAVLRAVDAMT